MEKASLTNWFSSVKISAVTISLVEVQKFSGNALQWTEDGNMKKFILELFRNYRSPDF